MSSEVIERIKANVCKTGDLSSIPGIQEGDAFKIVTAYILKHALHENCNYAVDEKGNKYKYKAGKKSGFQFNLKSPGVGYTERSISARVSEYFRGFGGVYCIGMSLSGDLLFAYCSSNDMFNYLRDFFLSKKPLQLTKHFGNVISIGKEVPNSIIQSVSVLDWAKS